MSTLELIEIIAGLVVGIVLTSVVFRSKFARLRDENEKEIERTGSRIAELSQELALAANAREVLIRQVNQLTQDRSMFEERASQIPKLERDLQQKEQHIQIFSDRFAKVQAELAAAQTELANERESTREKLELLTAAEEKLRNTFATLSREALTMNSKSFLDLATTKLAETQENAKGELEKRQQAIAEVVRPVNEKLDKFAERVRELELERKGAYSTLTEQVRTLSESQNILRLETSNLVKALRAPATRGRWGEIQLKRVVEMAGMLDHCDFEEQVSKTTENGAQRPDMIVKLPGGKCIVVDAKVPLAAYLEALEAPDDVSRKEKMVSHARQLRDHITKLSRKSYQDQFKPTPEFVVLFLSGEAFLYAALENDPALIEDGITDKVILATPTTLIAMLKAIAYGWRQENLERNVAAISNLGAEIYERLAVLGDHFAKLGRNLRLTVESYNDSVGSLERNVLTSARRLKQHDIETKGREIVDLDQTAVTPRILQAPELFPVAGGELPL